MNLRLTLLLGFPTNFYYADRGWTNFHSSDWEPFIPPSSSKRSSQALAVTIAQPNVSMPQSNVSMPQPNVSMPQPNVSMPQPNLADPVPNPEPNAAYMPDYNELISIARLYPKQTQMAVQLFLRIFEEEKTLGYFKQGEYNLFSRSSRGRDGEGKKALNRNKRAILKEFVEAHSSHGTDKAEVLSSCVDAIHKKISTLKTQ